MSKVWQIKTLIKFIVHDQKRIDLVMAQKEYTRYRLARTLYQTYKDGKCGYDQIREAPEYIRNLVLDAIEDYQDFLERQCDLARVVQELQEECKMDTVFLEVLIKHALPRRFFKCVLGLEKMCTPIESIFAPPVEPTDILAIRLYRYKDKLEEMYGHMVAIHKAIVRGYCRNCLRECTTKHPKTCPHCYSVYYCCGGCKAEDMKDKILGHRVVECDLLVIAEKRYKTQ